MREAFGMRVVAGDWKALDRTAAAEEEMPTPFRVDDLRVWDGGSPHHKVLDSTASRLFDAYQRVQHDAKAAVAAERERLRSALAADADHVVADAPEGLGPMAAIGVAGKRELVAVMAGIHEILQETWVDRAKEPRPRGGLEAKRSVRTKGGQCTSSAVSRLQHESRKLRKQLSVAEDRLKAADKEKRDLLVALRKNRYEPVAADTLMADVDREREKNVRLQSVVDEMYGYYQSDRDVVGPEWRR